MPILPSAAALLLATCVQAPNQAPASDAQVLPVATTGRVPALDAAEPVEELEAMPAREAWRALDRGEPGKAASIFRGAINDRPRSPALHFGAGYAAYVMGRLDAAIDHLQKAVDLDPRFVHAVALLAQVAYERGDRELALASMERAVALAPEDTLRAEQLARWRQK